MTIEAVWAYILRLAPKTPRFRRDFEKLMADDGLTADTITVGWLIRKINEGWFYPK